MKKNKMQQQNQDQQLTDAISPAYAKWFAQFPEIETLPISEWKPTHIIAYWCKIYKNHYGVDFTFKFNHTAPSKSFEILQIKRISQQLSSDPVILKDYIDWFFKNIIVAKKKRITSIALIANANDVNKYKAILMNVGKSIDRATPLPANYLEIIKQYNAPINNYGELAFVKNSEDYSEMINALVGIGFDIKILEKVK